VVREERFGKDYCSLFVVRRISHLNHTHTHERTRITVAPATYDQTTHNTQLSHITRTSLPAIVSKPFLDVTSAQALRRDELARRLYRDGELFGVFFTGREGR